jgi:hypothetical protein
MTGLHVSQSLVHSNARIKLYPSKTVLQVCNEPIFIESGWEPSDDQPKRLYFVPSKGNASDAERSLIESKKRAITAVRDIALCNPFTHMFTWTLSPELIDRYDNKLIYKKTRYFLSNATRRKGFLYVCIPEHHKDRALHMHGLCILGQVPIVPALHQDESQITTNRGQPIFNMPSWIWGWSTCVPLDKNYEKAVSYVAKYIMKMDEKIFGKWYLSSRTLRKRPDVVLLDEMDFDNFREDHPDAMESALYNDVRLLSVESENIEGPAN